jgi:hypothetical protein
VGRLRCEICSGNFAQQHRGGRAAAYYNDFFATTVGYHRHYTQSEYYFVSFVIVDRIRRNSAKVILEIACGPATGEHYFCNYPIH